MDLWVLMCLAAAVVVLTLLWRKEVRARLGVDRQTQWRNQELDRVLNELHNEKSMLEAALSTAGDLLLVTDYGLNVLYANPAATRSLGPLPQTATIVSYTRSLEADKLASDALEMNARDGIERIVQLNARPYLMRAMVLSDWVSVCLRDVSEGHGADRDD